MRWVRHFFQGWLLVLRFPLFSLAKWALTLVFAWVMVKPLKDMFTAQFSNRVAAETHANQLSLAGIWEIWGDLLEQKPGQLQTWFLWVGVFAAINVLLSAGLFHSFANHCRGLPAQFWVGVRRHFLPLALLPIGFLVVAYLVHTAWPFLEVIVITPDSPLWMEWVLAGVGLVGLWVGWLVYDLARVILCAGKSPEYHPQAAFHAFIEPIVAVGRALLVVVTQPSLWFLSLLFLGIQGLWMYGLYADWFPTSANAGFWIGQAVILGRVVTTLALWGAETSLWVGLREAAPAASARETVGIEEIYPAPRTQDSPIEPSQLEPQRETPVVESPPDEDDIYRQAGRSTDS